MNAQNIPQSFAVVKQNFVPKLDRLVFADYSQIELRLLSWYLHLIGHDEMMIAFREGRDLHSETAKGVFALDREPTEKERAIGKTLNFAVVYQGGVPTIRKLLDVPATEAEDYLARFHETWPYIGRQRFCKCGLTYCPRHDPHPESLAFILREAMRERGYAKTLIGRKVKPDSDHKIMSAVIQGGAAEIMKEAMLTTHRALQDNRLLPKAHLVSTIHDELMFDCTMEEFPLLVERIPKWMDYPKVTDDVPIPVDIEYSDVSWAEKESYDQRGT